MRQGNGSSYGQSSTFRLRKLNNEKVRRDWRCMRQSFLRILKNI